MKTSDRQERLQYQIDGLKRNIELLESSCKAEHWPNARAHAGAVQYQATQCFRVADKLYEEDGWKK